MLLSVCRTLRIRYGTLLLSTVYVFTHEAYYSTLLLSIILSLGCVCILVYSVAQKNVYIALPALMLLCTSKAFVDYSTSGLENPLLHLCIVVFFGIYSSIRDDFNKLFWLCFVASMSIFNRMDSSLLFAPALLHFFIRLPEKFQKPRQLFVALTGLLPFLLWELFAVVYYGFLFPNTAYAKLNVGIPFTDLVIQGLHYFLDSLRTDPITLTTIVSCALVVFKTKDKKWLVAYTGVILYLVYIIKIGGDFMSGRFLAAPFCLSVVILTNRAQIFLNPRRTTVLFVIIILTALINPVSPLRAGRNYEKRHISKRGIADERGWYYQGTGLLVSAEVKSRQMSKQYLLNDVGLKYKKESREKPVRVVGNAGFIGYYSGPDVYLIDHLGLSDPFLASLKPDLNSGWRFGLPSKTGWRIGHFFRYLPTGYYESKLLKKNVIQSYIYANLYDKFLLITRGEIFSWQRFKAIWKFNTGQYASAFDRAYVHERLLKSQNK